MRLLSFLACALLIVSAGCKPQSPPPPRASKTTLPPTLVGTFRTPPVDGHCLLLRFKADGTMEMATADQTGKPDVNNSTAFKFTVSGDKVVAEQLRAVDQTRLHLPISFRRLSESEIYVDGTKEVATRISPTDIP